MKKYFIIAFMALGMSAMAQHVTPLSIEIADMKLDSLRTLYVSEPTMYRAALEVVAQSLEKNAEEIKAAKAVLKVEQSHAKEMGNSLKEAAKMTASLKKLYAKEEGELKSMQKVVEKQQKTLNKQKELNQSTRDNYLLFLEKQQKELGYSLREVADRQRAIADLETSIQNGQTRLQTYIQETQQKALELAQLEAELKARTATLKAEQKTAKSLQ
jgi:chromosome segregation ATPase